jgi:hypothetical protein
MCVAPSSRSIRVVNSASLASSSETSASSSLRSGSSRRVQTMTLSARGSPETTDWGK